MSIVEASKNLLSPRGKGKLVRFSLNYNLKNLFLDVVNAKDRQLYDELICRIRDLGQEMREDDLCQILREARACISILDKNLHLFVQVILLLKWCHRSDEAVQEYQGFLLDLCSAHSYYTKNVVDHLVTAFKFGAMNSGEPSQDDLRMFNNLHGAVKTILSVIPMSRDLMISSIRASFPYLKRPASEHASFVYNTLQVITYAPTFRFDLLRIVVEKMVGLDVAIPKGESELITTVDHCMNVFFNFIRSQCFDSEVLNFQRTKCLYSDLVRVFELVLLSTHGTRYCQFVVFYVLSLKQILCVGWLQVLWSKVGNPNVAPVIRQACVAYTASLLSRASYVPISLVRDILGEMTSFVHNYIASQESVACVVQDTRIHGVFYSVCQAIFYVIAFRHKELTDGKKGLAFLESLTLSKIVQCRLNPLRACEPGVARNFASVTRAYQLAYCYSILERNARSSLPQLSRDHSGNETILQPFLETFFPFDPYDLPISSKFVKPIYREYEDFAMEEESSPMDEDDDFLDSNALSKSPLLSQSPKFPLLSQSPRQSYLNFSYNNHPGFLHIT